MKRLAFTPASAAFTLVELLVSTAIIALIMLVLLAMTNQTAQTWQYTTEKIEKFQESRDGFESMTRRISQATLNTYWDYLDKNGEPRPTDVQSTAYKDFIPNSYGRMSSLRFISGPMNGPATTKIVSGEGSENLLTHGIFFQAPLGFAEESENRRLNNLLNTWGYFVETDDDYNRPPFLDEKIAPIRWRSRLMEFMQPAERMSLHNVDYHDKTTSWFSAALGINSSSTNPKRPARVLAENVTALIIHPKLTPQDQEARKTLGFSTDLAPNFVYDSKLNLHASGSDYLNVGASVKDTSNPADLGGINPKNQLPPIVQVTMIAIDERSAARLQAKYKKDPNLGLKNTKGLFETANRLEDDPATAEAGDGDLNKYEKALVEEDLTYRVFTTSVSIRGAKWSRSQTK